MVKIFRYVTKESFDAYSWQLIETKQKFISQIYRGDTSIRELGDLDDTVLNYSQIKAIASGNPLILDKFKIDTEVQKLQNRERNYKAGKHRIENSIRKDLPLMIKVTENQIQRLEIDLENRKEKEPEDNCHIMIDGKEFTTYKDAGAEILEFSNQYLKLNQEYDLGEYRGFRLTMTNKGQKDLFNNMGEPEKVITVVGQLKYEFDLAKVPSLNIKKLDEIIDKMDSELEYKRKKVIECHRQIEEGEKKLEETFEFAEQLETLLKRQKEINQELNMDEEKETIVFDDEISENELESEDIMEDEETEEYEYQ